MTRPTDINLELEDKRTWSVVVVYEDAAAREEAVRFCDLLIERFWARYEFDVGWWSFAMLEEDDSAREATRKATEAALIVFAPRLDGEVPIAVQKWIEGWLGDRGDREGALVGLLDPGAGLSGGLASKYVYLRTVAHRCGLDYLTQLPEDIARAIPDSLESYNERAAQVTSVLDEILHQPALPPHLSF